MRLFLNFLSSVALLGAFAVTAQADDAFKFEAHGFVSTTGYYQSTPAFLLNGQGPLVALSGLSAPTFGFDARQSRFSLAATGPTILNGATPKALIEMDFFGLNGAGSYGEVSALPRLRLAYAELNWAASNTYVRIGQDWELLNAGAPTTLAHVAYAFYGAGYVAWREPGVGVFHTMDVGSSKLELSGQILKSDWQNPYSFGLTTTNDENVDAGQLSALPGFEGRVRWIKDATSVYAVGHWNRVDAAKSGSQVNTGADTITGTAPTRNFDVAVGKIGARSKVSRVYLQGEMYYGKNLGPLFGNLGQFPIQNDIREWGGWAQIGYDMSERWSAFAGYGTSRPNARDADEANSKPAGVKEPRLQNEMESLLVQYKEGGFAVGPEIYLVQATFPTTKTTQTQYAATATYAF